MKAIAMRGQHKLTHHVLSLRKLVNSFCETSRMRAQSDVALISLSNSTAPASLSVVLLSSDPIGRKFQLSDKGHKRI